VVREDFEDSDYQAIQGDTGAKHCRARKSLGIKVGERRGHAQLQGLGNREERQSGKVRAGLQLGARGSHSYRRSDLLSVRSEYLFSETVCTSDPAR
jgi:hypothetical protein